MYRLVIETLLGLHLEGTRLRIQPRLPRSWPAIKIDYRFRETIYHLTIKRAISRPASMLLDGQIVVGETIPLADDRQEHQVEVTFVDETGARKPERLQLAHSAE